jgi:hypothetical protein
LLISIEISVLGFLQLIEGALHLTSLLLYFKGLLLVVISPTKHKITSLAKPFDFLSQLTRGCEEYKIMMNKTMMEDKLYGSSNFNFLEDKTSNEDLLWVIQKCDTMTTSFMKMSKNKSQSCAIGEIISTPSCMHLYIYYLYHCHEGNCRTKEPFLLKSWIKRDLSAFKGTTH